MSQALCKLVNVEQNTGHLSIGAAGKRAVPGGGPRPLSGGDDGSRFGLNSMEFAEAARRLNRACARLGVACPAFRSPGGGSKGRTLRRRSDGSVLVSVLIRQRPAVSVLADMVDGVLAANGMGGEVGMRDELWGELTGLVLCLGGSAPISPSSPVTAVA